MTTNSYITAARISQSKLNAGIKCGLHHSQTAAAFFVHVLESHWKSRQMSNSVGLKFDFMQIKFLKIKVCLKYKPCPFGGFLKPTEKHEQKMLATIWRWCGPCFIPEFYLGWYIYSSNIQLHAMLAKWHHQLKT